MWTEVSIEEAMDRGVNVSISDGDRKSSPVNIVIDVSSFELCKVDGLRVSLNESGIGTVFFSDIAETVGTYRFSIRKDYFNTTFVFLKCFRETIRVDETAYYYFVLREPLAIDQ
jgi:hypothetical protein